MTKLTRSEKGQKAYFSRKRAGTVKFQKPEQIQTVTKTGEESELDEEQEHEDVYAELIKAQTEALKIDEEEKKTVI